MTIQVLTNRDPRTGNYRDNGQTYDIQALLTTDHALSNYGIPVLVIDGVAYGPAEAGYARQDEPWDASKAFALLPDEPRDERQAIVGPWNDAVRVAQHSNHAHELGAL